MTRSTTTLLCACLLGACGGAGEDAREPTVPLAEPTPAATPPAATPSPEEAVTTPAEPMTPDPMTPIEDLATTAPTPIAATPITAVADLTSIPGDAPVGTLSFERTDTQITMSGRFSGLRPGDHALYVHDKGDCSGGGKRAGGHFNPTGAKHGPPASAERHAGDFGNVTVDAEGGGTFSMTTDSITLATEGADTVVGRAVILYDKADLLSGRAGKPIACGVVVLREPQEVSPKGSR